MPAIETYLKGCQLYDSMPAFAFVVLHHETNSNPCIGCGYDCKTTMEEKQKRIQRTGSALTNKQIATMLGVTKRQVVKMRSQGTLEEALKETNG